MASMGDIARVYSLRNMGGPIYKCLEIYAMIKSSQANNFEESSVSDFISLLFWLEMAGSG